MKEKEGWQTENNCVYQALLRLLGTQYQEKLAEICDAWSQISASLQQKQQEGVPARPVLYELRREKIAEFSQPIRIDPTGNDEMSALFLESPGILKKLLVHRGQAMLVLTYEDDDYFAHAEAILLKDADDPFSNLMQTELRLTRAGGEIYFLNKYSTPGVE